MGKGESSDGSSRLTSRESASAETALSFTSFFEIDFDTQEQERGEGKTPRGGLDDDLWCGGIQGGGVVDVELVSMMEFIEARKRRQTRDAKVVGRGVPAEMWLKTLCVFLVLGCTQGYFNHFTVSFPDDTTGAASTQIGCLSADFSGESRTLTSLEVVASDPDHACLPLNNSQVSYQGKLVVVRRERVNYVCPFRTKVINSQAMNASAVVVINDWAGAPVTMQWGNNYDYPAYYPNGVGIPVCMASMSEYDRIFNSTRGARAVADLSPFRKSIHDVQKPLYYDKTLALIKQTTGEWDDLNVGFASFNPVYEARIEADVVEAELHPACWNNQDYDRSKVLQQACDPCYEQGVIRGKDGASLNGKIAMFELDFDRINLLCIEKYYEFSYYSGLAGAAAMIIVNRDDDLLLYTPYQPPVDMGTCPMFNVWDSTGASIRSRISKGETVTISLPPTVKRNITCNATDPMMQCPYGTRPCIDSIDSSSCVTHPAVLIPQPPEQFSLLTTTIYLEADQGDSRTAKAGQASFNPLVFGSPSSGGYFAANDSTYRVVFPSACARSTECDACFTAISQPGAVQRANNLTGPGGVAVIVASDVVCLGSYNNIVSLVEAQNATGVLYLTQSSTPYTLFGDSSERAGIPTFTLGTEDGTWLQSKMADGAGRRGGHEGGQEAGRRSDDASGPKEAAGDFPRRLAERGKVTGIDAVEMRDVVDGSIGTTGDVPLGEGYSDASGRWTGIARGVAAAAAAAAAAASDGALRAETEDAGRKDHGSFREAGSRRAGASGSVSAYLPRVSNGMALLYDDNPFNKPTPSTGSGTSSSPSGSSTSPTGDGSSDGTGVLNGFVTVESPTLLRRSISTRGARFNPRQFSTVVQGAAYLMQWDKCSSLATCNTCRAAGCADMSDVWKGGDFVAIVKEGDNKCMEPLEIISCADKRLGTQAVVYINEEDEYPALYPTRAEAEEQITPRDCGNTWGGTAAICVPTFSVSGVDAADLLDFTSCRQLPAAETSTPAPSASSTQSPQSIPTSPEEDYGCERFVREAASAARVTLPGSYQSSNTIPQPDTQSPRTSFPMWAVAVVMGGLVLAKVCVVIYQMRKMRARLNLATTEEGLRRRGEVERGSDATSTTVLAQRGGGSEMITRGGADSTLVFDNRPASAARAASHGTHGPASGAEADASTRDSSHGRVTWPIAPADATAPDISILPQAPAPTDDRGRDGATPSDAGPFTAGGAASRGGGGADRGGHDAHPPASVPPAAFAARVAAGGEGIVWPGLNLDQRAAAAASAGGAADDDTRPKEATGDELWGEGGGGGGGGGGQTTNPFESGTGAGGARGRAAAGGGRESTGARHGGAAATTNAQEAHPPRPAPNAPSQHPSSTVGQPFHFNV